LASSFETSSYFEVADQPDGLPFPSLVQLFVLSSLAPSELLLAVEYTSSVQSPLPSAPSEVIFAFYLLAFKPLLGASLAPLAVAGLERLEF
jgi:hypothetical protein